MNSRNQKQEELIRRLEEIRRQRSTIQTNDKQTNNEQLPRRNQQTGQQTRRNRSAQQEAPSRRRNQKNAPVSARRRNTQPVPAPVDDPARHSQETYRIGHHKEDEEDAARRRRQAKIREKVQAKENNAKKMKTRKKKANPLIEQLSNADSMSQAIILSEILSKPIALRPKSR